MDDLEIAATDRTPAIDFAFSAARLRISGESYPEDVGSFFAPVFGSLDAYLAGLGHGRCRFDFELVYFNSSSAKAIMLILERLDDAAGRGATIDVHWHYDPEDDTMLELGQDLGEDLEHASFTLEPLTGE